MSDYLKKLKNIFIVEDATTPQAEQPPVKERVTPPASSNAPTAAPIRASAAGTVNDRFMDVLAEALQNNNINVLKNEEHKFAQAIANQQENNIRNREADIQTLAQAIETKNKQIAQLQQEIKQHQAQMEQLRKEAQEAASKVETTKNDFVASYNTVESQIQNDIENMKKYL